MSVRSMSTRLMPVQSMRLWSIAAEWANLLSRGLDSTRSLPSRDATLMSALIVTLLVAAGLGVAQAQTRINRCTDAHAVTTLHSDQPCATRSGQENDVVQPASTAPFPNQYKQVAAPAASAPIAAVSTTPMAIRESTASAVAPDSNPQSSPPITAHAVVQAPPPPPLYQCLTPENDHYLSEVPEPEPPCVPTATIGIDGSQQLGAGQACTMVYDQCQRVPNHAACTAWRERVNQALSAWTFARPEQRDQLKIEYDRVTEIVTASNCSL